MEQGFFKVILYFNSTEVLGFDQENLYEFEFNDYVRLILNQQTNFSSLYSSLYKVHNLEIKDFEDEIYYYFEIDSEPVFDFNDLNSLHSALLISLLISSKSIIKNILVVHTADYNRRFVSLDYESIIPCKIETKFLELMQGDEISNKMTLHKLEIEMAKQIFSNIERILSSNTYSNLKNALLYFFNSSKSRFFEEMIINLSIVLESLFSPNGQNEISHQISFNLAKFISNSPKEAKEVYCQVKKFYDIRSTIVHGARVKDLNLASEYAIKTYRFLQMAFLKILKNEELLGKFNNNLERSEYLKEISFGIK